MKTLIFDLLTLAGIVAATIGAGLAWRPLWWIVPGLALLAVGIFGAWAFRGHRKPDNSDER